MVNLSSWFHSRSFIHSQFADLAALGARKRERGLTVTVVLPTLNVAETIGPIVETVAGLNRRQPLVDQLLVVDARSTDGTPQIAAKHGAEVHMEDELLPECGPPIGKGDAMWRALSVVRGEIVMYADADTLQFAPHFIYGVLGPLIEDESVEFVKAGYRRPFGNGESALEDGGGRVTELTLKPLFNLFYPELAGFVQPLAGEFAATSSLLKSLPFFTGYAAETGIIVDVYERCGLDAMAQVDIGVRHNRHQSLQELGVMAYSVLRALARRLIEEGRLNLEHAPGSPESLAQLDEFIQAVAGERGFELRSTVIDIVERPAFKRLSREPLHHQRRETVRLPSPN